jgi:hypothetical protein
MKTILILFLSTLVQIAYSQESQQQSNPTINTSPKNVGFVFEGGGGTFNSNKQISGLSLNLGLKIIPTESSIYKLRLNFHDEFILFTNPSVNFNEFNALYGKQFSDNYFRLTAYVGVGICSGALRGDIIPSSSGSSDTMGFGWIVSTNHELIPFKTLGIPLEFELSLFPKHLLGIGISINANLNKVNSIYGVSVKLEIGR